MRPIAVLWCLFLAAAFLSPEARGQSRKIQVYRDQYVVELPAAPERAADLRSSNINSQLAFRQIQNLGTNTGLIRKGSGAADLSAASNALVDYDGSDTFCKELVAAGRAISCSPNFEIKVEATPNDPQFGSLWGLSTNQGIDAPSAWDVTTGSGETIAAIIDTGIDYNHPDLAANVWTNPGEIPGNGIDDDGDGYIDDVHGINAINGTGNPFDDNGHGTHVAGTIGAVGNNNLGVAGINHQIKIIAIKFLNSDGSGSLASAIQGINYMVYLKNHLGINIRVANNSWGGGPFSQPLFDAIQRANLANIIFVAAAGNDANDNDAADSYPASYDIENVVSVAAIDKSQNLASFSNYGATSVDIAAPGVGIMSTFPGNQYRSLSGTSMATPHVTGALALLFSVEPSLTPAQAIQRIYESGAGRASLSGLVRTGRALNVNRAVTNQVSPVPGGAGNEPSCTYTSDVIDFNPNLAVTTEQIVQTADELNFYNLNLPFNFPYFGETFGAISISPNGVIYFGNAPSDMDYTNGSRAPMRSFAALQTDLIASAAPYGVRVAANAEAVDIYWRAEHYALRGQGDVEVWVRLTPDGNIEEHLSLTTAAVQSLVPQRSTIGATGGPGSGYYTYAYNDPKIYSGLGLRFHGTCVQEANVDRISVVGYERAGRAVPRAVPGRALGVSLFGKGTGAVELSAAFNSVTCRQTASINLSNGYGQVQGTMPRLSNKFQSLKMSVGKTKRKVLISGRSSGRNSSRAFERRARLEAVRSSGRAFVTQCSQLFASLH